MRRENRNEDAVSPVIGVMLLLVVTVVIAAVVVGFSTGLASSTGTTPTALFEVSTMETFSDEYEEQLLYLNIRQKGGDSIPLSNLQITLTSFGGENSDISHTLVATDEKSSYDATAGGFEAPSQSDIDKYEADKEYYRNELKSLKDLGILDYMTPDQIEASCGGSILKYTEDKWGVVFSDPNDRTSGTLVGKFSGDNVYPVTILGQEKPTESVVSTGDIIHIVPYDGKDYSTRIFAGTSVKWTISYIPTNSVIAKGEFEVIAD